MNKRNLKILLTAVLAVTAVFAVVLLVYPGRRYKVKDGIVIASELDVTAVIPAESRQVQDDVERIAGHYKDNHINTAILLLNKGAECIADIPGFNYIYKENNDISEKDIIRQLKKALEKEKIQLYVSLDCTEMDDAEALAAIDYLRRNYALAGIVVDNYEDYISIAGDIGKYLKKGLRKTDYIIKTNDTDKIMAAAEADIIIGENMNLHDYLQLKKMYEDKKFLFYHDSSSMESDVFALTNFGQMDGAVLSPFGAEDIVQNNIFTQYTSLPLFGFDVPDEFLVTYPAEDVSTYYDGIFVTGTGAADGTVNINGTDYPAQHDGTFGVYIELQKGENILNISSAYGNHSRTVTRKTYSYSGGGTRVTPWDDTVKLDKGRVVTTVGPLTSVLSDPDDDSSIIAGLENDTVLKVEKSVETKRNGKKTYAYQLSNGGYVLALDVQVTDYITSDYTPPKKNKKNKKQTENQPRLELMAQPEITDVSLSFLDNCDEVMEFAVNSNPAVFSYFGSDSLTLHFLDAEISQIKIPESEFFSGYSVVQQENGVRINLNYGDKKLWGYDVSHTSDGVKIYLKQAPQLTSRDKPLSGVTIMLDAGHGGNDSGALGVAGVEGVWEDSLNLAVAQATKALLCEYGADVIMTRDEDIFLELEERRSLVRRIKPDLFISVHHNSMDYSYNSTNAYGSECYYFTSQSKKLADVLCSEIAQSTNRRDRGEKTGYYYVTRTDIAPSVLMEYSFIINPQDYSTTYSDMDIYRAAWGTVQGILKAIP